MKLSFFKQKIEDYKSSFSFSNPCFVVEAIGDVIAVFDVESSLELSLFSKHDFEFFSTFNLTYYVEVLNTSFGSRLCITFHKNFFND